MIPIEYLNSINFGLFFWKEKNMSILHVYFDGSCEPNPNGVAGSGIYIPELDVKISKTIGKGKGMTNNVAEWTGAFKDLEYIQGKVEKGDKIVLTGDSQLVIRQLLGQYLVRAPNLKPFYNKVKEIIKSLHRIGVNVEFKHIPRDENKEADGLSRQGI